MLGENYGRKLMHGVMKVKGINGETKIGIILSEMNPEAQTKRQNVASYLLNPKFCNAKYFDNKIHYDQKKKLGMFGKIVGHTIDCNSPTFLRVRVLQNITEMIPLKYS